MRTWLRSSPNALWWLVVLVLTLTTAISQIDGVLGAMHLPNAPSYRVADISGFGLTSRHLSTDRPVEVVDVWSSFGAHVPNGSEHLTAWSGVLTSVLAVDGVFIVVYLALFYALLSRLRPRLETAGAGAGGKPVAAFLHRHGRLMVGVAIIGAAADVIEDLLTWSLAITAGSHPIAAWLYWPLVAASAVKVAAALLVIVYLIAGLAQVIQLRGAHAAVRSRVARGLHVLRGQVVFVTALAIVLYLSDQSSDLLRRWPGHLNEGVLGVVGVLWYAVAMVAAADVLLRRYDNPRGEPTTQVMSVVLLVVGVALLVVSFLAHARGLLFPGGLALAAGAAERLLSVDLKPASPAAPESVAAAKPFAYAEAAVRSDFPILIGSAPLIVFSLALIRAASADIVFAKRWDLIGLLIIAAALEAIAFACWWWRAKRRIWWSRHLLWASLVAVLVLMVATWWDVLPVTEALGTVAVVFALFVWATLLLVAATLASEALRPPRLLVAFGFRRTPVFALIAVWLAIANLTDSGGHYDVRTISERGAKPVGLRGAYAGWLKRATPVAASAPGTRQVVPMVMLAAEGGGIRAAYWTALVTDCLFDPPGTQQQSDAGTVCHGSAAMPAATDLFAASSVSGSSLGMVEYAAHQFASGSGSNWITDQLGTDFVAPTVAWGAFVDLPDLFAASSWGRDRAAVLEQAWQKEVPRDGLDMGLYRLWALRSGTTGSPAQAAAARRVPLLLLNGTSVQDGCRFETSALRPTTSPPVPRPQQKPVPACASLAPYATPSDPTRPVLPTTHSIASYLCRNTDVRLSTAALLSARFPYVSSSGRIAPCHADTGIGAAHVVDGGYFEGSGASTIDELWRTLAPMVATTNRTDTDVCVVPVFIQIDNHYASVSAPSSRPPNQLLVPPETLAAVHNTRDDEARQVAGELFDDPAGQGVAGWVQFDPLAHPAGEPPLGWALSGLSMSDMANQLYDQKSNTDAVKLVQSWFTPGVLRCPA